MVASLGVLMASSQLQQQGRVSSSATEGTSLKPTTSSSQLSAPANSLAAPTAPILKVSPQDLEQEPTVAENEKEAKSAQDPIDVPDPQEYQRIGKHRTALLSAVRKDHPKLQGTLFYSPAIITDGYKAYVISEARTSYSASPVYAAARLSLEDGTWVAKAVEVSEVPGMSRLAKQILPDTPEGSFESDLALAIASDYESALDRTDLAVSTLEKTDDDSIDALYARIEEDYASRMEALGKELAASSISYRQNRFNPTLEEYKDIDRQIRPYSESAERIRSELQAKSQELAEARRKSANELAQYRSRDISVGWAYTPRYAENGSYYGQISTITHLPRTIYVSGYYRQNGTYVRSHYRSRR